MANLDPFVIQWPRKWIEDPEIGPVIHYLNMFLHGLYDITDGGDAIESADVAEKYPWPTTKLLEESAGFNYPQQPIESEAGFNYPAIEQTVKQIRTVTVTSNYTAVDGDFINATSNAQITFPKYPTENSVIIVRNGDGSTIKLIGNGKNMNGESTGQLTRKSTSIEFYYFIDSDEWFAR